MLYQTCFYCYLLQDNLTVGSSCGDGEIRLVGGIAATEGRVEICINRAWGSICQSSWSTSDSNVVCSQLGYQPTGITGCPMC